MNVLVGIDYSITCPCLCIHRGDSFSYNNCEFHFLIDKKKFEGKVLNQNITGHLHKIWKTTEERFDQISDWAISLIPKESKVFLEGYSYGSKASMIFNISECTGLLKYKLYKNNLQVELVPPTTVKKHFSGKGNARKEVMVEVFLKTVNSNIMKDININRIMSPLTDIVDSYAIAHYGVNKTT